jgi:DNA-binding transcriptional LysR family regulator
MFHARILTYIDEVVRAGSIRKAAQRLGVAPSSISRQIVELEEELGAAVFDRIAGKLSLTSAGELLVDHIRQTLKEHEQLVHRIDNLSLPDQGALTIATMNGLVGGVIARSAFEFSLRYPAVRFDISSMKRHQIVERVRSGEADIGIGYNLAAHGQVRTIAANKVRVVAVMRPEHPLAGAEAFRFADCKEYPIVLADKTMYLQRVIRDALEKNHLRVEAVLSTDSIDLMKRFLADEQSIAFLSEVDVMEDVREGTLVALPILDTTMERQTLSIIEREHAVAGPVTASFVDALVRRLQIF